MKLLLLLVVVLTISCHTIKPFVAWHYFDLSGGGPRTADSGGGIVGGALFDLTGPRRDVADYEARKAARDDALLRDAEADARADPVPFTAPVGLAGLSWAHEQGKSGVAPGQRKHDAEPTDAPGDEVEDGILNLVNAAIALAVLLLGGGGTYVVRKRRAHADQ